VPSQKPDPAVPHVHDPAVPRVEADDRVVPGDERGREPAARDEADVPRADDDERASLRRALAEEQERALRLLADFDRFKRRVAREQETVRLEGRRGSLLPMLTVLDTLERALEVGSSDPVFYDGVVATHRQLLEALREAGAEPVATVGQAFDPSVHEAVATVRIEGVKPGIVAREARRGWLVGSQLLRPAQVVVVASAQDDA
jgi:molecular chaperone GrpE